MTNHTLQVDSLTMGMTIDKVTLTKGNVLEALEKISEIPEQVKAEMREVIEETVINKLQDLIDIPWAESFLEWLPELIELLKKLH